MAGKAEKTREKILSAAEKLFASKGFDAASVDSIATEAGVNKALIYYYFKNKADIVKSLFIRVVGELNQHLESRAPFPRDVTDMGLVREKLKQEIRFLEKHRKIISILLMEALKGGQAEDFLLKCAEISINQEAEAFKELFEGKRKALPDLDHFMIFEFFTGFMPILSFIVFKDKWMRQYKCPEGKLLDMFLDSFMKTHIGSHYPSL